MSIAVSEVKRAIHWIAARDDWCAHDTNIRYAMDVIELAQAGHHREAMASAVADACADTRDVNAQHKAGAVLALCGEYTKALEYLHAALRIHPDFHFTEMEIAGVHAARLEWEEAIEWYGKACKSAPNYLLAYRRKAEILRRLGRHDDARIVLLQAREIEPTDPDLVSELVEVVCFQDKREEAWPLYDAVIQAGRMRDIDIRIGEFRTLNLFAPPHAFKGAFVS